MLRWMIVVVLALVVFVGPCDCGKCAGSGSSGWNSSMWCTRRGVPLRRR